MECIFCKIVKKEFPSDIIYEDKNALGFWNVRPEAPIHFLLIPKRHLEWKGELGQEELNILARLLSLAKKIAEEKNIQDAYKIIFNVGKIGHIPHIHLHLLGGWKKEVPMHNV